MRTGPASIVAWMMAACRDDDAGPEPPECFSEDTSDGEPGCSGSEVPGGCLQGSACVTDLATACSRLWDDGCPEWAELSTVESTFTSAIDCAPGSDYAHLSVVWTSDGGRTLFFGSDRVVGISEVRLIGPPFCCDGREAWELRGGDTDGDCRS